jgi:RNA polymerase sigma factor (sigma-70 family)
MSQIITVVHPPRPDLAPVAAGQNWRPNNTSAKISDMLSTRFSLLKRVQDPQDQVSWQEFVELYQPLLLNFVRKRGLRDSDADDVVQEILIALVKRLRDFQVDHARGRFRTYLWHITHNGVINFYRKQNRQPTQQLDAELAALQQAAKSEPDEDFIHEQRQCVMQFALAKVRGDVPARNWTCFDARILRQRPAKEIAEQLGITTNAVYVYASRVLTVVRERCREYLEDLTDA